MARTAMPSSLKKGKGKGKKVVPKKSEKSTPKKERRSFSVRKPNITQSQPIKRKKARTNNMVLKEIKFYQKSTNFLVSKSPFTRFVRDIAKNVAKSTNTDVPRFTAQSLEVLQEVFEAHLSTLMETSYLASRHAKRVTLYPSDIKLINKVKGNSNL
jgi:histone H3